jgi:hypothetical protein
MISHAIPLHVVRSIPFVCEAECPNTRELPKGWISFATFRETAKPGVLDFRTDWVWRDAVLCPTHVAALERCLKNIGSGG